MPPPEPDASDEKPPESATPTPVVMWVNDGPVCVTTIYVPPPAPRCGCQCAACRVHQPESAIHFY